LGHVEIASAQRERAAAPTGGLDMQSQQEPVECGIVSGSGGERVVSQTRRRLAGDKPDSATRLVSLHDVDARPIAKGRLNRPVEFGYKAQVVDNEDGIVLDYDVQEGNPADAAQVAPAIRRVTRRTGTRRAP
jgi:hypothetical protein